MGQLVPGMFSQMVCESQEQNGKDKTGGLEGRSGDLARKGQGEDHKHYSSSLKLETFES